MASSFTTYDGLYKSILLRCPSASVWLARQWIDLAFRTIWDRRNWSWQRSATQFFFAQLINTGTVQAVRGSFTITGNGTAWTGDEVSRQFRVPTNSPIYTVVAVDTVAQTLTLDQPYGYTTNLSAGYQIYNAYQTMPTDFENLISVIDQNFNWSLGLDVTLENLNAWDAQRTNIGTPYCVVPFDYDGDPFNSPPLPRYEWWPHQQNQYIYTAWYVARPPDLSDPGATLPRNVRGNVLLDLALAQAARWPGTGEAKNPYFNIQVAMQHDAMGERGIRDMEVLDDSIYETDAWYETPPQIFIADSRWLQRHDV